MKLYLQLMTHVAVPIDKSGSEGPSGRQLVTPEMLIASLFGGPTIPRSFPQGEINRDDLSVFFDSGDTQMSQPALQWSDRTMRNGIRFASMDRPNIPFILDRVDVFTGYRLSLYARHDSDFNGWVRLNAPSLWQYMPESGDGQEPGLNLSIMYGDEESYFSEFWNSVRARRIDPTSVLSLSNNVATNSLITAIRPQFAAGWDYAWHCQHVPGNAMPPRTSNLVDVVFQNSSGMCRNAAAFPFSYMMDMDNVVDFTVVMEAFATKTLALSIDDALLANPGLPTSDIALIAGVGPHPVRVGAVGDGASTFLVTRTDPQAYSNPAQKQYGPTPGYFIFDIQRSLAPGGLAQNMMVDGYPTGEMPVFVELKRAEGNKARVYTHTSTSQISLGTSSLPIFRGPEMVFNEVPLGPPDLFVSNVDFVNGENGWNLTPLPSPINS